MSKALLSIYQTVCIKRQRRKRKKKRQNKRMIWDQLKIINSFLFNKKEENKRKKDNPPMCEHVETSNIEHALGIKLI